MTQAEFKIEFGRSFPFDALGEHTIFFRILIASITITFLIIVLLTNTHFENLDEHIKNQYQEFAMSLTPDPATFQPALERKSSSFTSSKNQADTTIVKPKNNAPDGNNKVPGRNRRGIELAELSYEGKGNNNRQVERPSRKINLDQVNLDSLLASRSMYKIERKAQILIEAPAIQSEEKERFGYRDQEEVYRIIDSKSLNIESCYEKAARFGMVNSGYVKLEFKVTSDGFILPQSIRIIESTLRSKSVEQCIKKNIRRLRGFEKLDKSKGIARVTHKFVFH